MKISVKIESTSLSRTRRPRRRRFIHRRCKRCTNQTLPSQGLLALFESSSRARGFAIRAEEANVPAEEVLRLRTISGSNDVRERYRIFPAVETTLPPRGLMDARRRLLGGEVFGGRELGWHSSSLRPTDSDVRRVKSSASRASLRTSILHCARDIC